MQQELYHYGIKGQRWGIRRFQNEDGTRTKKGKERYYKFTEGYTKATVSSKQSSIGDKTWDKEIEDIARSINGGKTGFLYSLGRDRNCAYCTTAYELRRRGMDVIAATADRGVAYQLDPSFAFKNAKVQHGAGNPGQKTPITRSQWNEAQDKILRQGEGARGNLCVEYMSGGAHSIAYEVKDGKVHVIDCQVGKHYKDSYEAIAETKNVDFIRTDNLKIDKAKIGKYVKDSSQEKIKVDRRLQAAKAVEKIAGVTGVMAAIIGKMNVLPQYMVGVNWASYLLSGAGVIAYEVIKGKDAKRAVAAQEEFIKNNKKQYDDYNNDMKKLNDSYNARVKTENHDDWKPIMDDYWKQYEAIINKKR